MLWQKMILKCYNVLLLLHQSYHLSFIVSYLFPFNKTFSYSVYFSIVIDAVTYNIFVFVSSILIDSYFTERYIPYNDHFNHALRESDLSMKVSKLEDKEFLIIQGTADQIVHQQHSLWLTKSLIQSGVTFRQQVI